MKNKKYYPFARNHYFYGKLLTVRDFEVEQQYFNNKRRLVNRLLNGAGVVTGLNVVLIDDQTISLEMGLALDYSGREILVEEPVTKKLKMIDNFNKLQDIQNVYLCIEYAEKLQEPVHSVINNPADADESNQFNRIMESYRLFLTDQHPENVMLNLDDLITERKILFQDEKITVEQIVPRYINPGQKIEVKINIIKKGTIEPVQVDYEMLSNYLINENGTKITRVFYQEKDAADQLNIQLNYPLYAGNVKETIEQLIIHPEKFQLKIGDKAVKITETSNFKVRVIEETIRNQILSDYYNQHFDEQIMNHEQQYIYLAKMSLITSDDSYFIDSFTEMPFKQYLLNNELLYLLMKTDTDFDSTNINNGEESRIRRTPSNSVGDGAKDVDFVQWIATGTEEIDLGIENSKNKRHFSSEIAHGLGKGAVAITLAVENEQDISDVFSNQLLAFGDSDVFEKSPYDTILPNVKIAALAYPEKGTFRIGLQLLNKTISEKVKIRWWAYKYPENEAQDESLLELNKIKIFIEPDTITLAPREKAHFSAIIEGTNNKECRWYVKEKNGGEIDANGVYEAPTAEGVYEIIAESVKYPVKKASAFIVVKA